MNDKKLTFAITNKTIQQLYQDPTIYTYSCMEMTQQACVFLIALRRQGRGEDAPGWGFWEYRHFAGAIQEMRGKLAPLKAYISTNIQCDIDLNKTVYQNDILAEELRLIAGKVTKKEIVKV